MDGGRVMGTANRHIDWFRGSNGSAGLDLDNCDTESQEEECAPFSGRYRFAQHHDGEGGRGEDFHLVGNLEGSDGEIADSNELQRVLNDIEDCGDGEFPTVGTEDFLRDLLYTSRVGFASEGVLRIKDAHNSDNERDCSLEDLIEQDGGSGGVRLGWRG